MRYVIGLTLLLAACDGPAEVDASAGTDGGVDAGATDAGADAGISLAVVSVEDLGQLPLPSDTVAGRDGASSGVIDGQLLWTFGDTFVYERTPVDDTNVVSATGAWATPAAPLELTQPTDPNGIPPQLVPYSDEELAINRTTPLDGWSVWPAAVIDTGDDSLLVLFQRIQRMEGGGFDGMGVGTSRIAPFETEARRDPGDLFTGGPGGELLYGAGGVAYDGDDVYLFACGRDGAFGSGCRVGRAPRARADERGAYEFWDGDAWTAAIEDAAVMIRQTSAAISMVWNDHLGAWVSVTSAALSNDMVIRAAPSLLGPWPSGGVRIGPSEGGIMAAGEGTNYLMQEQGALQSDGGRSIVITYSRPLGSFRGEVRLLRVTFE